jgi:hypothetical protein
MKKKTWLVIGAVAVLLAVLFVPIPTGICRDGGTRTYTALTYKIIDWNRLTDDGIYEKTEIYFFPHNLKSVDELWKQEEPFVINKFLATVIDRKGTVVLVEPAEGELERYSCDLISFRTDMLEEIGAEVGNVVEITYTGRMLETYPVSVDVVAWKIL